MESPRTVRRNVRSPSNDGNFLTIFLGLLVLRLINGLSIKTFFQPDEYFQSLEPALRVAFGTHGNPWITWEWHERLRSSLHPLLFATVYKAAAQIAGLLSLAPSFRANLLIAAPKLLQAVFAAAGDLFTYRFACQLYGPGTAVSRATLALTICSPWQWFASVRTLSNSLETTLTIAALSLWPWDLFVKPSSRPSMFSENKGFRQRPSRRLYIALVPAAFACILRPTNIIVWATISIAMTVRYHGWISPLSLFKAATACGLGALAVSVAADQSFYGHFVLPPLRFVYINVFKDLAVFYGRNRHDYYLTEGLPLLLTTALPFAIIGLWQTLSQRNKPTSNPAYLEQQTSKLLGFAVVTTISVLTLIAHKEVRFIYPLLPILHILAARPLASFFTPFSTLTRRRLRLLLLVLALFANMTIIFYTSFVHQRGVIEVMHYLRHEHEQTFSSPLGRAETTVGFLMPCHSTPWRSHLIYPEIEAWALTCEPPINLTTEERKTYLDEADVFYADPKAWIVQNMEDVRIIDTRGAGGKMKGRRRWPQYLVFFQQLEPVVKDMLGETGYEECWRGFNTHWHDDRRRQGDVVVWCLPD